MSDCIFCKIIAGEIPSNKVYEDDVVLAFRDLSPMAKSHVLVVPKKHMDNILELAEDTDGTAEAIVKAIAAIARKEGIDGTGFRVVTNCGEDGCQSVNHLHFHLLGGEKLSEKIN